MSTLSVPLTPDIIRSMENFIRDGLASSKAALARKAIEKYIEDQLVKEILEASKEPSLSGDLRELVKKFK